MADYGDVLNGRIPQAFEHLRVCETKARCKNSQHSTSFFDVRLHPCRLWILPAANPELILPRRSSVMEMTLVGQADLARIL